MLQRNQRVGAMTRVETERMVDRIGAVIVTTHFRDDASGGLRAPFRPDPGGLPRAHRKSPAFACPRVWSGRGGGAGRHRRPVAMPGRDQMHAERRPAGEGAQPGFRQMRQPVGPAMRGFVLVESLPQSRVSVPGLDRQLTIAARDALDRDPEPAKCRTRRPRPRPAPHCARPAAPCWCRPERRSDRRRRRRYPAG
jgi:hypothetical protein